MLPFNALPPMTVVDLLSAVVFYVNDFVWLKGVSSVMLPLSIVEEIALNYHLHSKVIYGELL